jgi:hypothetical protein
MDRCNRDCIPVCHPVKTVLQLIMVLLLDYEQLQMGCTFLAQVSEFELYYFEHIAACCMPAIDILSYKHDYVIIFSVVKLLLRQVLSLLCRIWFSFKTVGYRFRLQYSGQFWSYEIADRQAITISCHWGSFTCICSMYGKHQGAFLTSCFLVCQFAEAFLRFTFHRCYICLGIQFMVWYNISNIPRALWTCELLLL